MGKPHSRRSYFFSSKDLGPDLSGESFGAVNCIKRFRVQAIYASVIIQMVVVFFLDKIESWFANAKPDGRFVWFSVRMVHCEYESGLCLSWCLL